MYDVRIYEVINIKIQKMLDFTAFSGFFASNLFLVQFEIYYSSSEMVSRNCSIVL